MIPEFPIGLRAKRSLHDQRDAHTMAVLGIQ